MKEQKMNKKKPLINTKTIVLNHTHSFTHPKSTLLLCNFSFYFCMFCFYIYSLRFLFVIFFCVFVVYFSLPIFNIYIYYKLKQIINTHFSISIILSGCSILFYYNIVHHTYMIQLLVSYIYIIYHEVEISYGFLVHNVLLIIDINVSNYGIYRSNSCISWYIIRSNNCCWW